MSNKKKNNDKNNEKDTDQEFKLTDLRYNTDIKYIYHLSDIHIQLYKRHSEYNEQFKKLYEYLKKEKEKYGISANNNNEIPLICCITGDVLHSKTDLSPECIHTCYRFFRNISNIMPLVIIPGNHDLNMNNKARLDSLTPILSDLHEHKPVKYLKDTGLYFMGNIMFSHASIFDYNVIKPKYIDKQIKKNCLQLNTNGKIHKVLLYHGRVDGVGLFNGATVDGEKGQDDSVITPKSFDGYDLCLLGDIHKHQFIRDNIAYAGSFMQQNMGEDVDNHGLIKWDVNAGKGEFVKFYCDYAFVTIRINDKKAEYMCIDETEGKGTHIKDCKLRKNLRVRILYKKTPIPFINNYITILKYNHNVIEYTFQNDDDFGGPDAEKKNKDKKVTDITLPETQNMYIANYLKDNSDATEKEIEMIKLLNVSQNKLIVDQSEEKIHQVGNFKIIDIEFHNLFSYGSSNYIKFENFKGVVGIIAPNHTGKSAILDILLYTLYDKVSRKGTAKDIINNRKQNFAIKMNLSIGEWIYHIEKYGSRTKKGANVKLIFYRNKKGSNEVEHLEDESVVKTKKTIGQYFGSYEDMINTSFSIQDNSATFINSENTQRRKELERILKLDFIEDLLKNANSIYNKNKNILEHIEKKIDQDRIIEILKEKKIITNLSKEKTEKYKVTKDNVAELRKMVLAKTKTLIPVDTDGSFDDGEDTNIINKLEIMKEKSIKKYNKIQEKYNSYMMIINNKKIKKIIEKKSDELYMNRADNDTEKLVFNLDQELDLINKIKKGV